MLDPFAKINLRVVIQKMAKEAGCLEAAHPTHGGEAALDWALNKGILVRKTSALSNDDLALTDAGANMVLEWDRAHKTANRGRHGILLPKFVQPS